MKESMFLLIFIVCSVIIVTNSFIQLKTIRDILWTPRSPQRALKARVYQEFQLKAPKSKAKSKILIRDGAEDVFEVLDSWTNKSDVDERLVEEWTNEGKAFWSTPKGTRFLHSHERKARARGDLVTKPSATKYAVDLYINIGEDLGRVGDLLVRASTGISAQHIEIGEHSLNKMKMRGEAFISAADVMEDR